MAIDRIDVRVVDIPIDPPRVSSLGTFSHDRFGIVRVHADGLVGLGEVATLWNGGAQAESRFLADVLAPRLIGRDPLQLARNLDLLATFRNEHLPARAALDMALHDLVGKARGVPVHDLLGGRRRDEIVLSRSIATGATEVMASRARAATDAGFSCVKVKIGKDAVLDRDRVAAVRTAIGPDVALRVDANMAWPTVADAARQIARLEEFDLHSVEQPIAPGRPDDLRRLRDRTTVPIMADESVWSADDALALIRADAVDMLNVYVAESGGLRPSDTIFRLGELAGVGCTIGAMPELGIGTAASVHLGLAVPRLDIPADASGSMYHQHDVIAESFTFERGRVTALDGVGLGVSLDEQAVDRFMIGSPVAITEAASTL